MKIPKERRQLCSDVTNSSRIELQKDLERRREKAIQRGMDKAFLYVFLAVASVVFIGEIIMFLKDVL